MVKAGTAPAAVLVGVTVVLVAAVDGVGQNVNGPLSRHPHCLSSCSLHEHMCTFLLLPLLPLILHCW